MPILQAGNRAFHSQQYTLALHYYTTALEKCDVAFGVEATSAGGSGSGSEAVAPSSSSSTSTSQEAARTSAVLLCNRAAAYHCMGQFIDALADACTACALDGTSARAWQRRSNALAALGFMSAAADALTQCVSITKQQQQQLQQAGQGGNGSSSSASSSSAAGIAEMAREAARLRAAAQGPYASALCNHYAALGVPQGAALQEIRTSYRKLALKYHPVSQTKG